MRPRLQRAPLPKLLAHAAHRSHTKTENLGNFASALASLVELQNPLADRDRDGRHSPTLAHNCFPIKLHHLWKCSSFVKNQDLPLVSYMRIEHTCFNVPVALDLHKQPVLTWLGKSVGERHFSGKRTR